MKSLIIILFLFSAISCPINAQDHKISGEKMDNDYIKIQKLDDFDQVILSFYIENDLVFTIGEKMNEINQDAYMNGYNWEAFLTYYLDRKHPDIVKGMESDPEAGLYTAYYELNSENIAKAEQLANIIASLIESPNSIFSFLREKGDEIEWN